MLRFDFRLRGTQHCCVPLCYLLSPRNGGRLIAGLLLSSLYCLIPTSLLAATLNEIQERGHLIVAVKDNVRPLGFRNADGQLQGFEVDLARELANALLQQPDAIELQPVSNQQRLAAVLNNTADLTIARVSITAPRSRLVDFSTPYYIDGTAFVTRDAAIQDVSGLSRQTVAVLDGSSTISVVRSFLPTVRLIGVPSYQAAYELLESGEAVAFAADATVLTGWVQEYTNYRLLPTLISAEVLSVVMPRGNQYADLRQRVNRAIEQLRTNGWIRDRVNYWGLPSAGIPDAEYLRGVPFSP